MDHYHPEANGYEEQLIRQSAAVNRLLSHEERRIIKKAKARVRHTLALLRTQIELY